MDVVILILDMVLSSGTSLLTRHSIDMRQDGLRPYRRSVLIPFACTGGVGKELGLHHPDSILKVYMAL